MIIFITFVCFRQLKHLLDCLFAVNVSFRGKEMIIFITYVCFRQLKHLSDYLFAVNVSFWGKGIGNTRFFLGFRQRKQIVVQLFSVNISFRASEMGSFYQICCFLSRKIACLGDLLILNAISHINNMFIFTFLGKKSRTFQTIRRSMASLSARSVFTLRQNVNFMVDVNY